MEGGVLGEGKGRREEGRGRGKREGRILGEGEERKELGENKWSGRVFLMEGE